MAPEEFEKLSPKLSGSASLSFIAASKDGLIRSSETLAADAVTAVSWGVFPG